MKAIHIVAGALALVAGALALYATKGSPLHRRAGAVFGTAMLVMTSSALIMATLINPNRANIVAATLTFYLTATGWLAVARRVDQVRRVLSGLSIAAAVAMLFAFAFAVEAMRSGDGLVDGVSPPPFFMFGVVGVLGIRGDWRALRANLVEGRRRLARHLWRMSLAMWIATVSFFLGQGKVMPDWLRTAIPLRVAPVIAVLLMMIYWLLRVRFKRQPLAPWRSPRAAPASALAPNPGD